jgi:hypothetical protein
MKISNSKVLIIVSIIALMLLSGCRPPEEPKSAKPVIYLYPTTAQTVSVQLDYKGKLTCTYPEYAGEWKVKAQPDGIFQRDLL